MNTQSKFYKCACSCHALEVDTTFRKLENEIYFTSWEHSGTRPFSFREKLRWCFHILKTGRPWSDHIILNESQVKELIEQLSLNE